MQPFKLVSLLLTLLLSFSQCVLASEQGPPPVPVETQKPSVQTVKDIYQATGTLKAKQSAVITAELPGRIESIEFKEGTEVELGQSLYQLNKNLIQAEFNQANEKLKHTQKQLARIEKLVDSGSAKKSELDDLQSQQSVEGAQLEYIETRLAQMEITAPFKGYLGLSKVEVGDYVTPGQALINLEAIDNLRVDFKVPETLLKNVHVDQPFNVAFDSIEVERDGKVDAIDPAIDALRHSVNIRGSIDNRDKELRPGLLTRVSLVLGQREDALLVPETSVQLGKDGPFVYVIEDGVANLYPVKTGVRQDGMIEITHGISLDSVVVTSGQNRLYPGAKVMSQQ